MNEVVKRNIDRFPENFCFQLDFAEYKYILNLKSQIVTSTNIIQKHGGIRKLPFVFTGDGAAMLVTILKSKVLKYISR